MKILLNILLIFLCICQRIISDEYLGETSKHLFHFIHVTDIHITHFGHVDRADEFEKFCNEIIKSLIKPQVTVVSGDLTHNRDPRFSSEQYLEEWKIYQNILNRTHITNFTKWLDIRGNHDAFMDSDPESNQSYYRIYSNQGRQYKGSYQYTLTTKDNDTYSFIGLDMCPRPGPGRPFNFLGYINTDEMKNIEFLSKQTENSTARIFFGHYPLSFTYSTGLNQLMRHGIVYLNGHLHMAIKHLYAQHSNGLLELELGDWKDNRRFRIITIDSGLLSFEDVRFGQTIYAVISNPKAAKFKTSREPLERLRTSTHIRIVIFSKNPIVEVRVSIDSTYIGIAYQSIDNENLYVLPWNSTMYNDGYLHDLSVKIKDNQGKEFLIENQFSLSITTITTWTKSKWILYIHWPTLGMFSLLMALFIYMIALTFYRYRARRMTPCCNGCFSIWNKLRLRMMILCSIDLFYYSLISLAVFHLIGPWYIGYLTDGYIGVVFLWGTVIRGIYLPPDMQTFVGTIQLIFYLFPYTYCLSCLCYYRYNTLHSSDHISESQWNKIIRILSIYGIFIYTFLFVLFWSFMTTASYSFAWIISPFGISLGFYSLFLYMKCRRLKREDFRINQIDEEPMISSRTSLNKDN